MDGLKKRKTTLAGTRTEMYIYLTNLKNKKL